MTTSTRPNFFSSILNELAAQVEGLPFAPTRSPGEVDLFRRADVSVVLPTTPASLASASERRVVTAHARELSWLLLELGECMRAMYSVESESAFFGALAAAANAGLDGDPSISAVDLLRMVLRAAPDAAHRANALDFHAEVTLFTDETREA